MASTRRAQDLALIPVGTRGARPIGWNWRRDRNFQPSLASSASCLLCGLCWLCSLVGPLSVPGRRPVAEDAPCRDGGGAPDHNHVESSRLAAATTCNLQASLLPSKNLLDDSTRALIPLHSFRICQFLVSYASPSPRPHLQAPLWVLDRSKRTRQKNHRANPVTSICEAKLQICRAS